MVTLIIKGLLGNLAKVFLHKNTILGQVTDAGCRHYPSHVVEARLFVTAIPYQHLNFITPEPYISPASLDPIYLFPFYDSPLLYSFNGNAVDPRSYALNLEP